jgi:F420-dependent oxidoreductase-like protein
MRIGLQVPSFSWPGQPATIASTLAEIARTADDAGFASLWVMDHFFQIHMVGPADEPMLEAYSALSYLAGVTKRVKLGALVTGVIYRYPGVLIKTATTLDVLSGGRSYFGIGAAWNEQESRGLGVPFPPLKDRFEQLEETLKIAHQMWRDDTQAYHGKHYQLAEPINHPQPLSTPHPPIMIGGGGEQKTLRLVAQYADACNLFARLGSDELRRKLEILRGHCEAVGRDYDEIERTAINTVHLAPGAMTPSQVIAQCRELADIGIQHIIFNMPNTHEIAPLETFGREIIPAVADL